MPASAQPPSAPQQGFFGSAESIWQAVMAMGLPSLAGFSVEILPEIDSSNSELMRRARAGLTEPTLLVAEQQSAGRGRLGRQWTSSPGDSLTFSLGLLLQPDNWDGLSLALGTSAADSLHADISLKWPNDLWVRGAKLAGILIETASVGTQRYVVVGVGINIAARPADGLSVPPAWLQTLIPGCTAAQALDRVALPLLQAILQFERTGFTPFAARFAARDALRGRDVVLSDGTQGGAQGVDDHGALLVHTCHGLQRISSAEVSVRPVQT